MRFLVLAVHPTSAPAALPCSTQGHCQAFKQCSLQPMGDGWVEIEEIRLNWLHRPLPASARISQHQSRSRVQHLLTPDQTPNKSH
jgi:hypothetical protein